MSKGYSACSQGPRLGWGFFLRHEENMNVTDYHIHREGPEDGSNYIFYTKGCRAFSELRREMIWWLIYIYDRRMPHLE